MLRKGPDTGCTALEDCSTRALIHHKQSVRPDLTIQTLCIQKATDKVLYAVSTLPNRVLFVYDVYLHSLLSRTLQPVL